MPTALSGSDLSIERAVIADPRVATFYFGPDPWSVEVEEEFKSGIWEEDRDLWLFLLGDTLVAGARLDFANLDAPHRDSPDRGRKKYFLILSFGVNVPFQGKPDSGSDPRRSYARSILAYIEEKGRAKANCIGLSLWVRAENERARHVYEEWGFKYGPSGSFIDEGGEETFEMRKWFAD